MGRSKRLSLSGQHLDIEYVDEYRAVCREGLSLFHSRDNGYYENYFVGWTEKEVFEALEMKFKELDHTSSFSILAAIEAFFRMDAAARIRARKQDPLSKHFRELYSNVPTSNIRLEDIFDAWKEHHDDFSQAIKDLKGAWKYRNWIAHGRYFTPRFEKRYNYENIYKLAKTIKYGLRSK